MSDESIIIPDFLPASFQDDIDGARRQVEDSRLQRYEAEWANSDEPRSEPEPAARARRVSRRPWLAAPDLPMAIAATLVGLIGVGGLTAVWGWLAVTHESLWWTFAAGGAVVFVGLSVLMGLLCRRSRNLLAASRHSEAVLA